MTPTRLLCAALLFAAPAFAAGKNPEVSKPLTTIINSIRYGRDLAAIKHFHGEEQGKFLMGEDWAKGTDPQRKEFAEVFHTLFAKIAFPNMRKNFEHLQPPLYGDPRIDGDKAEVDSTLIILHPLKKQELKLKYTMAKDKAAWKVVDVAVLGDSMLEGIRDQITEIKKEADGKKEPRWDAVLKAMKDKAEEVKSVTLK